MLHFQFVANKDESEKDEDKSALDLLKERSKGVVKCRICKEDHWTTNCPYKDTLGPLRESLAGPLDKPEGDEKPPGPAEKPVGGAPGAGGVAGGKYVPPSRREGPNASGSNFKLGESMPDRRRSKCIELPVQYLILLY